METIGQRHSLRDHVMVPGVGRWWSGASLVVASLLAPARVHCLIPIPPGEVEALSSWLQSSGRGAGFGTNVDLNDDGELVTLKPIPEGGVLFELNSGAVLTPAVTPTTAPPPPP